MTSQQAAPAGAALTADKKLALSGGLLALAIGSGLGATPADAALITTPLNVNVGMGSSYTFGPVGDEFTIQNLGFQDVFNTPDCSCDDLAVIRLLGNTTALSKNFVAVKAGSSTILPGIFPGLQTTDDLLDFYIPGDHISDLSSSFATSGQDLFFEQATGVIYGLKSVDIADPWGYLQLDILSDNNGGEFLRLDKFAFESVPDAPAVVVPEPGTLSLFAVGGAAFLAARRRKKQQKPA